MTALSLGHPGTLNGSDRPRMVAAGGRSMTDKPTPGSAAQRRDALGRMSDLDVNGKIPMLDRADAMVVAIQHAFERYDWDAIEAADGDIDRGLARLAAAVAVRFTEAAHA